MLDINLKQHWTPRTSENHVFAILDLDGTVSDNRHRLPLLPPTNTPKEEQPQYWLDYHKNAIDDPCFVHVYKMYCWLAGRYSTIRRVVFTGRSENERYNTVRWLNHHKIDIDELYCRNSNDFRSNAEIKLDMLNSLKDQGLTSAFAFEDDVNAVNMFREQRVYTYQWVYGQLIGQR